MGEHNPHCIYIHKKKKQEKKGSQYAIFLNVVGSGMITMFTRKIVQVFLFMQSKPSITRHECKTDIVVTDKQINKKSTL